MIRMLNPGRKHLALLMALVGMLMAQPLVGHRSELAGGISDAVLSAICLYLFFIVFGLGRERWIALALILPAFASNFGIYVLPDGIHVASEVVYHFAMVGFLGFAVAVILLGIFRKKVIGGDDVIGAFCGYMLLALVWANLFTLAYLFAPKGYSVNQDIAWRMAEWHHRRALFEYLSFTTLTSLGYNDITPVGPPAYTLTWLEVMVGQFYMAVVVAQLVGLKLAQALRDSPPGR
jgi:voltage-gated potassium channel